MLSGNAGCSVSVVKLKKDLVKASATITTKVANWWFSAHFQEVGMALKSTYMLFTVYQEGAWLSIKDSIRFGNLWPCSIKSPLKWRALKFGVCAPLTDGYVGLG